MQSQRQIHILKIKILKKKAIVILAINNLINTLMLSSCNSDLTLYKVFFLSFLF
jgi:hypothetical protein